MLWLIRFIQPTFTPVFEKHQLSHLMRLSRIGMIDHNSLRLLNSFLHCLLVEGYINWPALIST